MLDNSFVEVIDSVKRKQNYQTYRKITGKKFADYEKIEQHKIIISLAIRNKNGGNPQIKFILDTGSSVSVLPTSLAKKNKLNLSNPKKQFVQLKTPIGAYPADLFDVQFSFPSVSEKFFAGCFAHTNFKRAFRLKRYISAFKRLAFHEIVESFPQFSSGEYGILAFRDLSQFFDLKLSYETLEARLRKPSP